MGAEPFFFKQAEGQNPQKTYARVMKFFVIIITLMFLVVALYIEYLESILLAPLLLGGLKSSAHIAFGKYVFGYLLQSFYLVQTYQ